MMYANVKRVNADISSDSCPKVVEFENGNLNNCPDVAKRIRFDLQKPRFKEGKERILTADTGNMRYFGQETELPCRYYIGVLDNDTGDMEIYNTHMFHMQPTITEDNNKSSHNDGSETQKTYSEKNDQLVEAFGSARQKRAVLARKKNLVDKAEINSKILEVAEKIDLSSKSPQTPESPAYSITPAINLQASSPAQLYNIEDIISSNDEPVLLEDSNEFMAINEEKIEKWRASKRYPEYILEHLSCLPKSEEAKVEKASQLRYFSYMMQLFKLTYSDLRKKDCLSGIPAQIRSTLFSEFSLEKDKKRFIPKRFKDKTLCYMLVLALIIDEYVLDCSTLMRDLKLGPARISTHLKAIGCHVESKRIKRDSMDTDSGQKSNTITIATLKLPLPISFLQKKETV